jgi:hypothetical protein
MALWFQRPELPNCLRVSRLRRAHKLGTYLRRETLGSLPPRLQKQLCYPTVRRLKFEKVPRFWVAKTETVIGPLLL